MGRIVDPSVADHDGVAPSAAVPAAPVIPSAQSDRPRPVTPPPPPPPPEANASKGFLRTGHPVRDRLMAKAVAAAGDTSPVTAPPSLGRSQESPGNPIEDELDDLAGHQRVDPTRDGSQPPNSLSPGTLLLLATLLGVAALASLFTFLIEFAPRHPVDLTQVSTPPAVPTTAPAMVATSTSEVPAPPPRKQLPGPWRITEAGTGQRIIRSNIGKEPFLRAVQNAGLPKDQAYRVYTALKDEKNLDRCRPKDEFVALVESDTKRVIAFEYIVSRAEVYQAREVDGLLKGKALDLKVKRQRVQGALVMTSSSFAAAVQAAHLDPGLGRVINEALDGHTSVEEFSLGDRLRVVAQELTILGEFYRYTGIEALEYLPRDGTPLRIYYNAERKRYYDSRGRAPGEGGWRKPCKSAPITSRFNPQRMHPILKKRMPHNGTDFGAPTGTPVGASSSGEIIKLGNYGPNGNFIAIRHRGGYETGYSHLSRFEPGLKAGDKVQRMQVIGYVGSTGRSTGPHLHFSAKKDGKFIDPESLQLDALTVLAKADRERFKPLMEQYDKLLEAVALPPAPAPLAVTASAESATASDGSATTQPSTGALSPTDIAQMVESPEPATPQMGSSPPSQPQRVAENTGTPAAPPQDTQPASVSPAPAPAQLAPGSSLYLSDEELIRMQSATDEGEVAE